MSLLVTSFAVADDIVAVDTLYINDPEITPELYPNDGEYVLGFVGPDTKGVEWKSQVTYLGDSFYGTFSDEDIKWGEGSACHNFIRQKNNSDKFYAYKHVDLSVADNAGATIIDVNALYNNFGQWHRVLIHAVIPAPATADTVRSDLGVVSLVPSPFEQYMIMEAANDSLSLAFGIQGSASLKAGTYYQTDLLMPELVRLPEDSVRPVGAELIVAESVVPGQFDLELTMRSDEDIVYVLSMHTGAPDVRDTIYVSCLSGNVIDNTQMFNIYQLVGTSATHTVALAVVPSVIEKNMEVFPPDSIVLAYTQVADNAAETVTRVAAAQAYLETPDPAKPREHVLHAELIGTNGTRYIVTIPYGFSYLPEAKDTITFDCGEKVGRIFYTEGMGYIGVLLYDDNVHVQIVGYNGYNMRGTIYSDDIVYDANVASYVAEYTPTSTIFHDLKAAEMRLDSVGDTLHIAIDAITLGDTLYRFTAWMAPKRVLTGPEVTYSVDYDDEVSMPALRTASSEEGSDIYRVAFQRADEWIEDEGELIPVGDTELLNFYIWQTDWDGISGTFGYSDGTIDASRYLEIHEGGVEFYLAPVAGTLSIVALQPETVDLGGKMYKTHWYQVQAEVLAENGVIYHLSGQNVVVCMDPETGEYVELTESETSALHDILSEQGYKVRKVLRDGRVLIEDVDRTYDLGGQLVDHQR